MNRSSKSHSRAHENHIFKEDKDKSLEPLAWKIEVRCDLVKIIFDSKSEGFYENEE